jgi:glycerol dehydrogenase-like iron-containing ADH family enzyme
MATFDWELSQRSGKNQHEFFADDARRARAVLADVARNAVEIRVLSDAGIQAIVECYIAVNTICLPRGHYRAEEGSEHFLFYELEERTKQAFIHGQIIGLGIHLMSRLQENDADVITALMDCIGLNYQPSALGLDRRTLHHSLRALRGYTESAGLWHSIIQERDISDEWIDDELSGVAGANQSRGVFRPMAPASRSGQPMDSSEAFLCGTDLE